MGVSRMKFFLVSALALLAVSRVSSTCLGSINIKDYGEVFIVAPDWCAGAISIQDNGFTMRGNSRLYYANRCEYGVMEGNKHTIACTLHTCNGGNGYWDSCDRGGCQTNAFNVDNRMMCPDGGCKINTAQPFTISHYQTSQQA